MLIATTVVTDVYFGSPPLISETKYGGKLPSNRTRIKPSYKGIINTEANKTLHTFKSASAGSLSRAIFRIFLMAAPMLR